MLVGATVHFVFVPALLCLLSCGCVRSVIADIRSPEKIPRGSPIFIAAPTGADHLVNDTLASSLDDLLLQDGAVLRHDAAWSVTIAVDEVTRCREGWFPPANAHALARVTLFHEMSVAARYEVRALTRCRSITATQSAMKLAAELSEHIAEAIESRRAPRQ